MRQGNALALKRMGLRSAFDIVQKFAHNPNHLERQAGDLLHSIPNAGGFVLPPVSPLAKAVAVNGCPALASQGVRARNCKATIGAGAYLKRGA